jgi:hypothetical protein
MAQNTTGGATPWLAFVVGALFVVLAMVVYFVLSGEPSFRRQPSNLDIRGLTAPFAPSSPTTPSAPALPPAPSTR